VCVCVGEDYCLVSFAPLFEYLEPNNSGTHSYRTEAACLIAVVDSY
jgi:hypothetical protein